jgi:hypothetical protein
MQSAQRAALSSAARLGHVPHRIAPSCAGRSLVRSVASGVHQSAPEYPIVSTRNGAESQSCPPCATRCPASPGRRLLQIGSSRHNARMLVAAWREAARVWTAAADVDTRRLTRSCCASVAGTRAAQHDRDGSAEPRWRSARGCAVRLVETPGGCRTDRGCGNDAHQVAHRTRPRRRIQHRSARHADRPATTPRTPDVLCAPG